MCPPDDLELLELHLDRELDGAASAELERRLAVEPDLAAKLETLRHDRATRMAAMSLSIAADAGAVDRLIASVRAAQAVEVLGAVEPKPTVLPASRKHWYQRVSLSFMSAAAACLAVGAYIGISIEDNRPSSLIGTATNGVVAGDVTSMSLAPQMRYVVSVMNVRGETLQKIGFSNADSARACAQELYKGIQLQGRESELSVKVEEAGF
ncbi:MAG: hypothetical protein QM770_02425 [Tepidisphaeraceae bacterium]